MTTQGASLSQEQADRQTSVVLFRAGRHSMAMAMDALQRIHENLAVEPIQHTQPWFLGLAVAAGRLLPLTDLGIFLGGASSYGSPDSKILQLHSSVGLAGLCVDDVTGMERAEVSSPVQDQPSGEATEPYLSADSVWSRGSRYRLLDARQLLASERFLAIGAVATS